MTPLKNAKHERFAHEIANGATSREAYKAAGYESKSIAAADTCASRLLSKVEIQARIKSIKEAISTRVVEKTALTKAWVLAKLVENVERAMTAEPVRDKEGNPIGDYKYDGSVANKALELLGKEMECKWAIARTEVGKPGDFQHLDDEALDAEIKRMVAADPELGAMMKARAPRGATKH